MKTKLRKMQADHPQSSMCSVLWVKETDAENLFLEPVYEKLVVLKAFRHDLV